MRHHTLDQIQRIERENKKGKGKEGDDVKRVKENRIGG